MLPNHSACMIVPATYSAAYLEPDEESKAKAAADEEAPINPLDINDDAESVDGPPGQFVASLSCTFPSMEPSADIEAKRDAGACELTLVMSVAPNGTDFVGACKVPAFCTSSRARIVSNTAGVESVSG